MSKITGSQTKKTVYDSKVFWQALTVPDLELRLFEGSFGVCKCYSNQTSQNCGTI